VKKANAVFLFSELASTAMAVATSPSQISSTSDVNDHLRAETNSTGIRC
jgi:hypothetical protein